MKTDDIINIARLVGKSDAKLGEIITAIKQDSSVDDILSIVQEVLKINDDIFNALPSIPEA